MTLFSWSLLCRHFFVYLPAKFLYSRVPFFILPITSHILVLLFKIIHKHASVDWYALATSILTPLQSWPLMWALHNWQDLPMRFQFRGLLKCNMAKTEMSTLFTILFAVITRIFMKCFITQCSLDWYEKQYEVHQYKYMHVCLNTHTNRFMLRNRLTQ